ncbi:MULTISPECIES: hypothetical protein [Thiorhodovibrio]|uniref:hypothetical protein n=1 Tax=Thiorhodovibrio TaxID=61593 RepID=UPI0019140190|nr:MULTISPECIES: hypothetical protein [Thiorhodovibrio]MBK5969419.1 hypothetical protein [Thiorhodovibrio winogradskyi]WPL11037.1 hypothetical protein Thiosp_00761 [Thiorhodovibrio litoralis]
MTKTPKPNRLKLGFAAALIAGAGVLASMPAQAFWWPWSGGGPWNGGPWGGNPWYGGYYPYYGSYYPYYGGYAPYYGGYTPYYGYPYGGYAYPYSGYYPYQSAPAQSSSKD